MHVEHKTLEAPGQRHTPRTEEIAALARELWHARGCPEGSPEEDWYEAERQLARPSMTSVPQPAASPRRTLRVSAILGGFAAGVRKFCSNGGLVPVGLVLLAIPALIGIRTHLRRQQTS